MGDRANVYVHDGDEPGVFLYTHSSGWNLPETVRKALIRGTERWDDGQYLARIIFCEMVGRNTTSTTGFGISAKVGDGEDRIVDVDTSTQTVTLKVSGLSHAEPMATYIQRASMQWSGRGDEQ